MALRASTILIVCIVLFSQNVHAQKSGYDTTERIIGKNIPLNEIKIRAVRHFTKNYPDVHDEKWTITSKGFIASFMNDAKIQKIYYNKKGEFRLLSITYNEGRNFPEELKRLVRIGYPGSQIENIVEIFNGIEHLYGITISNNEIFRRIEYSQGETKIVDEYIKQM